MPIEETVKAYAWSGEVVIDGVMRIDGDLTIAPGTRVSFTPNSSLIIRGKLFAGGEEGRPVVFGPARNGEGLWGAVVLDGRGANGSTLNKKTIDAYKKNWQYGDGGHVFVSKSSIRGADAALTADKDSSLRVFDSFFEGETGGKRKNILIHETVDTESAFERRARTKEAFVPSFEPPAFIEPYRDMMDPTVRGRTAEN